MEKGIDEIPAPPALISVILSREYTWRRRQLQMISVEKRLLWNLFSPGTFCNRPGNNSGNFQGFQLDGNRIPDHRVQLRYALVKSVLTQAVTDRRSPTDEEFYPTSFRVLDNEMLINCHQTIKGRRKNDAAGDEGKTREVERIKKVFAFELMLFLRFLLLCGTPRVCLGGSEMLWLQIQPETRENKCENAFRRVKSPYKSVRSFETRDKASKRR